MRSGSQRGPRTNPVRAGGGEHLGDGAGMDVGILAQVDGRQMKAEDARPQQAAQPTAGQRGRRSALRDAASTLRSAQGLGTPIGFGVGDGVAQGFQAIEAAGRGGEPGVDAGQGAAVGSSERGAICRGGRGKAFGVPA